MRRFFPTPAIAATVAAVVAGLSACTAPRIADDAAVVLVESPWRDLHPLRATDAVSQKIGNLIHGALVRIGPEMQVLPELAESWQIRGYRLFRFRLRSGLRFHDGAPIHADDAVRAISRYLKGTPHSAAFSHVTSVRRAGLFDLVLETDAPQPFLLMDLPLVKIFKEEGGRIVGAGRFRLSSESSQELTLERFGAFPEPPAAGALRSLVFRFVADDTTRYQLLLRGDGNVMISALGLTKTHHLRKNHPLGMQLIDTAGVNNSYLCFNLRDPRLASLKVRRAIAHAIDIAEILRYRLGSLAYPATGILAPAHAPYYEPRVERPTFDPRLAERLLDEAGFPRKGGDRMRFSLLFKTTTEKYGNDMARILAGYLRAVGIDVRLKIMEPGTFFADINSGNFQLFHSRWIGVVSPSIYFRAFHSSSGPASNRGRYSNPEMDRLLESGMLEADDGRRREVFSKVQKLAARDLPYVNLWHWNNTFIGPATMTHVVMYPNGNYLTLADIRVKR